jgi:hypothetical protein
LILPLHTNLARITLKFVPVSHYLGIDSERQVQYELLQMLMVYNTS